MSIAAAMDEEAVGVVTIGQVNGKGFDPMCPQTLGELTRGSLAAAVVIGVESQVHSTRNPVA
jgi:hypothetical protein